MFQVMKKYILSLIALAFGMQNAFAQTVSVDDVTFNPGETKEVSINLNNSQKNIVSFQMDLTLPDGISINKAECSLGDRITDKDQELTIGKQPDGSIRLTSTSFALNPISGTSGEIVKLSLTASESAKGGSASLKNIRLATTESQKLTPADMTFNVYVLYTLTYKVDEEDYRSYSIACGTAITPEAEPTKVGYTFSGWSEIPETMPAHDVTVTGSFSINSYTLTYKIDGEVYKTSTIVYGTAITPEEEPTKEGYVFSGWSEIPVTMPAYDVVVTGSFIPNNYTLTYILDGEEYKTYTVSCGSTLTPEPLPTKEGYTFSGWIGLPATMPAHDVTVTGSFTINQYKLEYILDDEEYKSYEIDYNTPITPETVPEKKGMTFSGWGEVPETMPAHDVTLTGSYSWSKETIDGIIYQVTDTLSNYASVIGQEDTSEEVTILPDIEIGGDTYTVRCIADGALPQTVTISVPVGKLLLWLWENGYVNLRETGSGNSLTAPELSLAASTASSLTMTFSNEYPLFTETLIVLGTPVTKKEKGYEIVLRGLEPDKQYEGIATYILTFEDASYTKTYSFRTEPLTLTTKQPRVISEGNVIVTAQSNLDDEETNVGFEWRRTDWTDDFESKTGGAYLYEGMMEGYVRNINSNYLWKFRPYYTSNAGQTYYGDWKGMDPSDFSYYEPTVHTYATINVQGNSAVVKGYAMRGTDNITSQGFICWNNSSSYSLRKKAASIPTDAITIIATGNVMTATFEDLEYETQYCYVAFVTTEENETFYGEVQTFSTSVDPDGIEDVKAAKDVTEIARYDIQGRKLDKTQKGINIIRYSDGTSRKVLVK